MRSLNHILNSVKCSVRSASVRFVVAFVLFIAAGNLFAQDMPVPIAQQIPLFTKILSFERKIRASASKELVVLVVYQNNFRNSLNTKNTVVKQLNGKSLTEFSGAKAKVVSFALDSDPDTELSQYLEQNRVNFVYIAPLRAYSVSNITKVTRAKKILTGTGVTSYVSDGVSIGLDVKGDKPEIVINLGAAKLEGADLSSQLLKMARIVR